MPRLRRVDCSLPGIRRRRVGRGFAYVDADGARVDDPEVLDRIRALVIPPAWADVWICPLANGHIQAVGTDARGRRQYRYHDAWRLRRDREKFDHMLAFAQSLPRMRKAICADLAGDHELSRRRVLACATRLLDLGFFRIGTEGYAEENQTYGLATMRKDHVTVGPGDLVAFDYTAKSGLQRLQSVVDPDVADVVRALKRRRGGGPELLAYRSGGWCDVRSADINDYVKEVAGGDFTAKDFRTWNATVLAAVALAVSASVTSTTGRKRAVTRAVAEVAHYLGNTPAVCRASYVDPRVVDRYREGVTIADTLHRLGQDVAFGHLATQGAIERAVVRLLA